jgi:hypothetical protein
MDKFEQEMGCARFWAIFSRTHLITLLARYSNATFMNAKGDDDWGRFSELKKLDLGQRLVSPKMALAPLAAELGS